MNFLYPAFLIGAALIAIPIVLHLLRRDVAPPVPFTAVRLLRASPIERSRRRRLRDLLLLAARITAIVLLAAAFARPYVAGDTASGSLHIVAVDRSFSMGAPGTFARAIDLARAAIDEVGAASRVVVISFDDRAIVVAGPSGPGDARAALADLRPGFGATRYAVMLQKAAEVAEGSAATLTVVTDLQRAGWDDQAHGLLPQGIDLRIADAGAAAGNLAIAGGRVEADRLVASILNAGPGEQAGDVRAVRDGRALASARFTVPPGGSVEVPLAFRPPDQGALTLAIDDSKGFGADNAWFVVLDPFTRPAVLFVTSGADSTSGLYLARAIEAARAAGGDDALEVASASGARVSSMQAADLARYRAVVLLSTRGLDRRARGPLAAFVRGGGGLLIAASPDVEPSALSTMFDWQPALPAREHAVKAAALSATDLRHPIFEPFGGLVANLGQVRFDRAWQLKPDGWDVAARFTDGAPALVERPEGKGRVVLFASDVDRRWNDFPLHPSFVPFAVETLRHVAGPRDDGREYVVGRVPESVRPEPGVYALANRTIAVNVDTRESTTARLTEQEFRDLVDVVSHPAGGPADLRAQQVEAGQGYWRYALMLMLGVLVVESVVGKR
jgi:hypothetical protein